MRCDPLCLGEPPRPEPVQGDLPPAICLVDEDGPYPLTHSLWFRGLAAALAAAFALSSMVPAWVSAGTERKNSADPAQQPQPP